MNAPLRVAILAHSTNPRGGVVHALELGDALTRLGHDVAVHAPDATGKGFFRRTACRAIGFPVAPAGPDVTAMVEARIDDYLRFFERPANLGFDVWHAQDGISANALATLRDRSIIPAFARTVHHVDGFTDPRLTALQLRGIMAADRLFTVSRMWRDWLGREVKRDATLVGNGVDLARFSATRDASDEALRTRLGLPPDARVFLAVGGVEERKNTVRILQAFASIHKKMPRARLVIAGGASLLDHGSYQVRFAAALAESRLPESAVLRTGPLPNDLMPPLYRAADALVFASVKEGFGLVVLEAMASGVPVVVSRIAPFTEYLEEDDVCWCDPFDPGSIAGAMTAALEPARRAALAARGRECAARHSWKSTAQAHLATYHAMREPAHA